MTDVAGNPLAEDVTLDFFVRAGDANRDRKVSLADFLILRSNFGQSGKVFSEGDFNYDGTMSLADFLILRGNFGENLPPPVAGTPLPRLFADGHCRPTTALLNFPSPTRPFCDRPSPSRRPRWIPSAGVPDDHAGLTDTMDVNVHRTADTDPSGHRGGTT